MDSKLDLMRRSSEQCHQSDGEQEPGKEDQRRRSGRAFEGTPEGSLVAELLKSTISGHKNDKAEKFDATARGSSRGFSRRIEHAS